MDKGEIVLYQPNDTVLVEVRLEKETVWLTQAQIAELFGTKRPAITKHLNNIYKCGELEEDSICSILEHVGNDGKQVYHTKYYNLDAILSVGYRVNSINATRFRRWANKILKDYILKGYAINHRIERVEKLAAETEKRVAKTEEKIDFFVKTALPPVQGVFFDGQIFDAYALANKIIKSAKQSIVLIDNYIDESVLTVLAKKAKNVNVTLLTKDISKQLKLDIAKFNQQYPAIEAKTFNLSHDRFLIIDDKDVYHLGASLKDLGRKWFAFSKMGMGGLDLLGKIKGVTA
ncbi:MAG: virulence RhuM family protein [Chitinispirillia bacterium]|nr:virulence RhuM family protein [Chitinispirillia bacterium]MCL2242137.1 virulence RhuM family protein [Chitinispirillia bacterium]